MSNCKTHMSQRKTTTRPDVQKKKSQVQRQISIRYFFYFLKLYTIIEIEERCNKVIIHKIWKENMQWKKSCGKESKIEEHLVIKGVTNFY